MTVMTDKLRAERDRARDACTQITKTMLDTMDERDALVEVLERALCNEGQDGCCLPIINVCHCWRCLARLAIARARGES